ncbi:glycoside hydrolase family 48 protein [Ruminiclostridium cellobioparum]|uniref:cellulase n=1 Tax=Ruminiclostridium cellobioparum subsp. termitidis CT1112 TaxID=1195236 RepID=S0FWJ1_RUMCE|nr:glycoside hydrolase family 48 protein [Ruminiclostridium cellobioparum]EMS73539.1 glycoside hydrolase 48 family protein [Ruminiclostridium cellobioparum subsp. termitidis CT1112]
MRKRIKKFGSAAIAAVMTLSVMATTSISAAAGPVNTEYQNRFQTMYQKIKDPANKYFSPEGVPYHSIETLLVEAPDYGHVTTSEAFSYYMWLEAMNGRFTGDFSGFGKSWDIAEKYIIPSAQDQPNTSMSKYDANKPATYAPEWELPSQYPARLDTGAPVGRDPINRELVSAYGNNMIYGMHWLLDADNWYGYGQRADGKSKPSYINTFQRGEQESTWETIPQPCWDAMNFGGKNGFLDLFTGDNSYSKQFKYTNAPDADARAVQATYWANLWAKDQGKDVSQYVSKASKMGDYLRYSMFDKYFRKIGSPSTAGTGYDAAHYLLSWYYAWGGGVGSDWAWIIGCSHNHFGYQNPLTAWVLSNDAAFKPKSTNGASDWSKSLSRQIEFYQWLQSAEGAIAGGASNSYNGRYETWPSNVSTFYGMGYEDNPVYADPGSNTWFGMQVWSMQRMAEYYYQTKDVKVKNLLDKWAKWANSVIRFNSDGTFQIPNEIGWQGQPDTWNGTYTGNPNLHVSVVSYGTDLGCASSLANTLAYYAAASGDTTSQNNAKKLLDSMWNNYQDSKGISVPESRSDYHRLLDQEVYVPQGWSGTMANGDKIQPGIKFIDIRSKYKQDPDWQRVEADLKAGVNPTMVYHRFWAQSEFAIANGVYAVLFPAAVDVLKGDVNNDKSVDALDLAVLKKFLLDGSATINVENSDMNSDGVVDAIDYAQLKIKLLNAGN